MLSTLFRNSPIAGGSIDRLSQDLNRLVDAAVPSMFGPVSSATIGRVHPALNVWRDKENIYAEAELPGFRLDDIEIYATEDTLTLRGSRANAEPQGGNAVRIERSATRFERSIRLPVPINSDGTTATFENGVLRITLPVAEQARARRVAVTPRQGQQSLPGESAQV